MNKNIKISFTGDLMVLSPQLKSSFEKNTKSYDFDIIFSRIRKYLKTSDYVIGNLETPLAGKDLGYTHKETVFNTPIEFGYSLKDAGFTFLSIANNHCLDRHTIGLRNTINNLKTINIDFGGGYLDNSESLSDCVQVVNGKKIAIFTYTYGTNSLWQNNKLQENEKYIVDLLREQDEYIGTHKTKFSVFKKILKRILPQTIKEKIKPIVIQDCVKESSIDVAYISRMRERISKARKTADIVLLYLHSGGQYNSSVGSYTKNLVDEISTWGVADAIIINHPHCVLKHEWVNNTLVTYSLGNFCFTPNWGYYYKGVYADYSIVLNAYINQYSNKIEYYTFYITKCVKQKDGNSVVYHVKDIKSKSVYNDCLAVLSRFFDKKISFFDIDKEEHNLKDFYT